MEPRVPPGCARRYAPRKVLASGGFGVVWVAEQVELGRPVALKLLTGAAIEEADAVARFKAEARLTASLAHPHIVHVVDHDVEDGTPWIAYELLSGPSLRGHLAGGPIPWPEAVRIVAQVADALEHVHARGVLHRDIKPENVLQSEPGHWKVTDFGIAKWTGRDSVKTATGMVIGTPAYLAPEQIQGEAPTFASDIYALGILLFELVTGAPPFESESPILVLEKHLKLPVPRAGGVPEAVQDVIATALAKRPEQRFASMAAMRRALEACAREDAGGARATGRTARVARSSVTVLSSAGAAPSARGHAAVAVGTLAVVALIAFSRGAGPRRDAGPEPGATPVPVVSACAAPPSPPPRALAPRRRVASVLGQRDNAVMAYDPVRERVILFGGAKEGSYGVGERDTWEWDGRAWTEVPVDRKACPTFRFRHAMATDAAGRRVLLFGGTGPTGFLGDLWSWDGRRWAQHGLSDGPWSRAGHAAVWDSARSELVVFGSQHADPRTWIWNGRSWRSVAAGGPASRDAPKATYDEHRQRVVSFAGREPGEAWPSRDTWEWDGRAWTQMKASIGAVDTICARPVYDPERRRLVLFGGTSGLWEYDGRSWRGRPVTPSPPLRYDHAMAFDRKRGVLVVYGGSPIVGQGRLGDTWEWDGASWREAR